MKRWLVRLNQSIRICGIIIYRNIFVAIVRFLLPIVHQENEVLVFHVSSSFTNQAFHPTAHL